MVARIKYLCIIGLSFQRSESCDMQFGQILASVGRRTDIELSRSNGCGRRSTSQMIDRADAILCLVVGVERWLR